jgi:hypothetical protein
MTTLDSAAAWVDLEKLHSAYKAAAPAARIRSLRVPFIMSPPT